MQLTLFFLCTIAGFSSIFASNGSPADCCLKTDPNKVSVTSIRSYWQQDNRLCGVTAIVFTLGNGKVLCSDPDSDWTKRAMRKLDEEAEQKRNHRSGLAPDDNTEGSLITAMLPLTSRWPQVPAHGTMSMGKDRADTRNKVRSSKPQRKRIQKKIMKKRKGRNKGRKGKRKPTKQPVFNPTSSFTTSSYK